MNKYINSPPFIFKLLSKRNFQGEFLSHLYSKYLNESVDNCNILEFYCWLSSTPVSVKKSFQVSSEQKQGKNKSYNKRWVTRTLHFGQVKNPIFSNIFWNRISLCISYFKLKNFVFSSVFEIFTRNQFFMKSKFSHFSL